MEMRIIGGQYRGTKIVIPEATTFRPTKNMVREAVVSSILPHLQGAKVLELCAGSSIMSLEFLSRGAALAVAVDKDSALCKRLPFTIKNPELRSKITYVIATAESYLSSCNTTFDIIFFDPPYYENALTDLLPLAFARLRDSGILIFESASDDQYVAKVLPLLTGGTIRERAYGKSYIRSIRKGV